MKVRLKTSIVEDRDGKTVSFAPGDEVEFGEKQARVMIDRGQAEAVGSQRATKEPARETTNGKKRPRRKAS